MCKWKRFSVFALAPVFYGAAFQVVAVGTGQGGRDVYHVPLSWCVLSGSPAEANPNITSESGATDTETDALIWRRHERPTDNIFLPEADITFRSAINNAWSVLDFPIISDPDLSMALEGDVRGEDNPVLGAGSEYDTILTNCEQAYSGIGRAGIGITAVNINLFHNGLADYLITQPDGSLGGTPIGWGGCARFVGTNTCAGAPFDSSIMVADNQYLYPTVSDRTLPVTTLNPTGTIQYGSTDPFDQLVGHELGHALGLDHADGSSNNLMFGSSTDNDGDGRADNIAMSTSEIASVRASALNVPGLEIDPPARIDPGNFVAMTLVDGGKKEIDLPPHSDLGSLNVALDKSRDVAYLNVRMRGVIPEDADNLGQVLVAIDAIKDEEFTVEMAKELDFPLEALEFKGADTLLIADIFSRGVEAKGWRIRQGNISEYDLKANLLRLTVFPYYAAIEGQKFLPQESVGQGVRDMVSFEIPAAFAGIKFDQPFNITSATTVNREEFDLLEQAEPMVFEDPSFPHCFADAKGIPGGTAPIRVNGLLPKRKIHALFGPDEVYRGTTDRAGELKFDLPIPKNARGGLHLVTVGIDQTALTADCVVDVAGERDGEQDIGVLDPVLIERIKLLNSHERLLTQLARLLEARQLDGINSDDIKQLMEFVEQQGKMIEGVMANQK